MKNSSRSHISTHGPAALLLLLACAPRLAAQEDNLARLQGCARAVADSVTAGLGDDTICVSIVNHEAAWLLDQAMVAAATDRHIPVRSCDSAHPASISMAITSLGVLYRELDDADRLERLARFEVSATLPATAAPGGNNVRAMRIYSVALSDTIDADGTSSLERSGYDFARGAFPPRPGGGFWKKLVEPAVVLGSAVVIVVLLFTVRSK
jgi:hypothetical protein